MSAIIDHPAYSGPALLDGVFALAEPDCEPLPLLTRVAVVWDGACWIEIDPTTGMVLGVGGQEQEA